MERENVYPFTAIIGQDEMKLALILNVINPLLGGVLVKGEKGTAKSTAVRALPDLLPPLKVVELPVSATEDRVVGTLDIEAAVQDGKKRFEPGILAAAHENILYVDEINLLEDHIVDILLDAAAMGVNTVEREGISHSHPSRFVLAGTMNPEEGDIRPQLLDRFALCVTVSGEREVEKRVEVVKYRLAYEDNPEAFRLSFAEKQKELADKIRHAKEILPRVKIDDECFEKVARLSIELGLDGHRADLTVIKAAATNAAFEGRERVTAEDLLAAARLALPHRMRRRPFEEGSLDLEKIESILGG